MMKRGALIVVVLCAVLALAPAAARADTAVEESEKRNWLEVFVGVTQDREESEGDGRSGTLAVSYLRWLPQVSPRLGISVVGEYAGGNDERKILVVPLVYRFEGSGWRLLAGPGAERRHGKTEFLFRAGAAYEFELGGRWALKPEVVVDFVDGEQALVYGVNIGYGF